MFLSCTTAAASRHQEWHNNKEQTPLAACALLWLQPLSVSCAMMAVWPGIMYACICRQKKNISHHSTFASHPFFHAANYFFHGTPLDQQQGVYIFAFMVFFHGLHHFVFCLSLVLCSFYCLHCG
jgi:hypothetical protein